MSAERLFLLDGHSYLYRAYHAIPSLSTSRGVPTNAVYGFTNMLLKVVREQRPDLVAIVFDSGERTERHAAYKEYKAQRTPMPDALSAQIPYVFRMVEAFRIPVVVQEGIEADDLIATLARKAESRGLEVTIVTGDKDLLQLVSPRVRVYDSMKDRFFGPAEVRERFGVGPERVIEIMGLMGDAIDNLPGVPGVGEKTAVTLIQTFGTIEDLLARLAEVKRPKLREALRDHVDQARATRELARLRTDLAVALDPDRFRMKGPDWQAFEALCRELEFFSLLRTVSPAPRREGRAFRTLTEPGAVAQAAEAARAAGSVALQVPASDPDPMRGEPTGAALSWPGGETVFIPIRDRAARPAFLEALRPLLSDAAVRKNGHDLKPALIMLERAGLPVAGADFDTQIASYLLNAGRRDHTLEAVALEYLGRRVAAVEPKASNIVEPKASTQVGPPPGVDPDAAARAACETVDVVVELIPILTERLAADGMEELFRTVEMPLVPLLARMQRSGFKVNAERLAELGKELEARLASHLEEIWRIAGSEFNVNSPRQLSKVLFENLGLKPIRRTKTGYSTDESVLIQLATQHDLPAKILEYRQLAKIQGTYVDALPPLVHPETGRLHTALNQTIAATGRLSSSDPNLQNIPIKNDLGRRLREAFVAEDGCLLLSGDYNQVELRILAHLSGDEALAEAFRTDTDIHTATASRIFGLPLDQITPGMRRAAKTVNFGVLYGMSPFGLSQDLGISQAEAKKYIDGYFAQYRGVKEFIDRTIDQVRRDGYTRTILGRRRYIPEMSSADVAARGFAERTAVNSPLQGSAADLIKKAMLRAAEGLDAERLAARMILQVHDELLFEVPVEEVERVKAIVREAMEGAMTLSVPLRVDLKVGRTWAEV